MDFNITGPWNTDKLTDNAYKIFSYIHPKYSITEPERFNNWLTRLLECEKNHDFNKLVDLRKDILRHEFLYSNR